MTSVVFVAPYALESTLRFVRATAGLSGVRLGIVSQEPPEAVAAKFPAAERERITECVRVGNALDADQLERAVVNVAQRLGGRVDTLLGILEPLQEPLAIVRERLRIPGMDTVEARRFRDKSVMKETLRSHGLPCARHRLASTTREALDFAQQCLPLVAKPPAGAGSRDTFRVDQIEQLEQWLAARPPSAAAPLLLEEFIQGEEFSFDSVTIGGEHRFHSISSYAPTPLEVMETPWIQWAVLLPREIDGPEFAPIREAGPAALKALGMVTGMTHMEWFRRPDGSIAISEVAARPPGAQFTSLISWAHDRDFYRAWAELSVLDAFDPPERRYAAGAAYLRGQGAGAVESVEGLDQLRSELGELVVEAKLPQPGQPKAESYEGEGYVILRHPETAVVAEGLKRLVSTLHVRLGRGPSARS
ncbi:MAG: hypothetical protein AAFZ65_18120 [Planctomycetota bacterium]